MLVQLAASRNPVSKDRAIALSKETEISVSWPSIEAMLEPLML